MSINDKLNAIKIQAQESLTSKDDDFNQVSKYVTMAHDIRKNSKLHNEDKIIKLTEEFNKTKIYIEKKKEESDEMTVKQKLDLLSNAYYKYAKKKASLDRLGEETLFFDSITDTYVRISWVTYENYKGEKEERLLTHRFKPNVIKKFIDLDSKRAIGVHLDTKLVSDILRGFRPYIKEFEPLKPKFMATSLILMFQMVF